MSDGLYDLSYRHKQNLGKRCRKLLTQNLLSRCSGSSSFVEMVTRYRLWRANHIKVRYLRRFPEGFLSSTILRRTLEEHKRSNNIFLRQQTTKPFLHRVSHRKHSLTVPHIPSCWRCLLQEHRCFKMCWPAQRVHQEDHLIGMLNKIGQEKELWIGTLGQTA